MKIKWEWKEVDSYTHRTKVVGGWIVKTETPVQLMVYDQLLDGYNWQQSICFVPDPNHLWEVELPKC